LEGERRGGGSRGGGRWEEGSWGDFMNEEAGGGYI